MIAEHLRVLAILADNWGLVPSVHMVAYNCSRGSWALF